MLLRDDDTELVAACEDEPEVDTVAVAVLAALCEDIGEGDGDCDRLHERDHESDWVEDSEPERVELGAADRDGDDERLADADVVAVTD